MATSSQMTDMMKDLTCVICLQLYEEPVTLPCGHSFCCCCLKKSWESREGATGFACPNCRKVFLQKPPLNKNVILASVVTQMKPSGSEGIGCTRKEKVHKLVKLGEKDERPRCTKHGNLLDFYCKDDESLMCLMCMVGHQDHQVVAVEVAHAEFKGILVAKYPPLVESTQQVKSRMQQVQQEVKDAQVSGRGSVEKLEQKQRAIYRAVDENVKQIKRCLNGRLEVKLSHLEYQRANLQKEMDSLDDAESNLKASLEKLEATSFLLGYKDVLHKLESRPHFTSKHSQQPRLLDFHVQEQNVKSLIQLDENLIKGIRNELVKELKISDLGTNILKRLYGRSLSLDQNSAHSQIVRISEDLKTATLITTKHQNAKSLLFPLIAAQHRAILGRTQHRDPKRTGVLSDGSFSSGRHYWEVDVRSCRFWRIGLALNSIVWKGEGNERRLGVNNESWCVEKCFHQYTAIHNKQRTHLPVPRNPERLGFLLDCEKGELRCFGDTRILHVFRSNFTESVKPVLQLFGSDSGSVHMCSL